MSSEPDVAEGGVTPPDAAPPSSPPQDGTRPGSGCTVFISYARADQPRATQLVASLEAAGCVVWWDALIEGGAQFAHSIEAALKSCDVVIVLWSQAGVSSDWVRDEAAVGRDRRRLVPLAIDGTPPPLGFGQYHALDFTRWQGGTDSREFLQLLRAIEGTRDGTRAAAGATATQPLPPQNAPATVAKGTSRRRLLVGAAAALPLVALGAWKLGMFDRAGAARDGSIAVLPFTNLSGDAAQDYLASGVAEEVRVTLSLSGTLRVLAEASSSALAHAGDRERRNAQEIASTLGVAWLLDGTVRRAGNRLRMTAELIDGATGFSRWARAFERPVDDIFDVQREIAAAVTREVVSSIAAPVPGNPAARPAGGTHDVVAYDAYLAGRALYDLGASELTERAALARFDAAIARDAGYAAAYVGRSRALSSIASQYAKPEEYASLYTAAIAAAERAVALAPGYADAYSALGLAYFQGRLDARSAREPFERSRTLGTGNATVCSRYAVYAARIGQHAAARPAIARALELDPLNPAVHRAAGSVAYAARRYADSLPPLRRALALNPSLAQTHAAIGQSLLMLGRLQEAKAEFVREPAAHVRLAGLAIVLRRLGDTAGAKAALATLENEHGDDALYQRAQVHAAWGDRETALSELERARMLGDAGLVYVRNDPWFDPLRSAPRFIVLLRSMGFE